MFLEGADSSLPVMFLFNLLNVKNLFNEYRESLLRVPLIFLL